LGEKKLVSKNPMREKCRRTKHEYQAEAETCAQSRITKAKVEGPKGKAESGSRKIECGSGPATPSRIVRVFLARLCHRGGGAMTASARQRSQASAAFAEAQLTFKIVRS
jgi:hypothetical protein